MPPTGTPIFDPKYWNNRAVSTVASGAPLHHIVYCIGTEQWDAITARHQWLLKEFIRPQDSVLDIGCGYGRLLDMMPFHWKGKYLGIDISDEMISMAENKYPNHPFLCGPAEEFLPTLPPMDVAVLISVRGMILREEPWRWPRLKRLLRDTVDRILCLEYYTEDIGLEI